MMLAAAKGTDWSDGRQTSSTKDRTLGMRKEMGSDIMTPAPGTGQHNIIPRNRKHSRRKRSEGTGR